MNRLRVPTAPTEKPVGVAARVKKAIKNARAILNQVKKGDANALAQATMLQGLLSGDVMTAAIAERQRLQRENLKLRQRLTHAKMRTERAKAVLLEKAAAPQERLTPPELLAKLREIYGFQPFEEPKALPPAVVTIEPAAP